MFGPLNCPVNLLLLADLCPRIWRQDGHHLAFPPVSFTTLHRALSVLTLLDSGPWPQWTLHATSVFVIPRLAQLLKLMELIVLLSELAVSIPLQIKRRE